jgi:hypothetical protein
MSNSTDSVAAPVAKAASALTAGVGTSVMARTQTMAEFFPQTFNEYLSAAASLAALGYTLWLMWEAWEKRRARKKAARG